MATERGAEREPRPQPQIPIAGIAQGLAPANGEMTILSGLDGVVRTQGAIAQQMQQIANDMTVLVSRQGQMYGIRASAESTQGVSQREITTALRDAISEIPAAFEKAERRDRREARPSQVRVAGERDEVEEENIPRPQSLSEYERTRDFFRDSRGNFSLRNARRWAGGKLHERIQNRTWGEQLTWTPHGWKDAEGKFVSASRAAEFLSREKKVGAAREFARALSQGQTLRSAGMGAMPGALARGAGVVGAGLFAANQIGNFMESQRAANAEWQSIMGGGQADAIGERIQQRLFGFQQFGFMDSEEAQRLYRGVSETGLRGSDRDMAMSFALDNYREMGMSVKQSMEIIQEAAKTGSTALGGVAEALERVTESAAEAGVNADQARQSFIRSWKQATDVLGGGSAAAQLAGAETAAITGLGPQFADVSLGLADPTVMRRVGTAVFGGAGLNEVAGMIMEGGAGREQYVAGRMELLDRDIQRLFRSPEGYQYAQQLAAQARDSSGRIPSGAARAIIAELLRNRVLIDMQVIPQYLKAMGLGGLDMYSALEIVLQRMAGGLDLVGEMQEASAAVQTRIVDTSGPNLQVQTRTPGEMERYEANQAQLSEAKDRAGIRRGIGGLGIGWLGADVEEERILQAFRKDVDKTGRIGGISQMIKDSDTFREGIKKVAVQTKDGPRVVTLAEAMEHYRDQIDRGDVTVVEGSFRGDTLKNLVGGGYGDESIEVTSATREAIEGVGMTEEEWRHEQAKAREAGEGGAVILDLTPEARKILEVRSFSGPVTFDEEWFPSDPHVTASQLPGG